MRLYRRKNFDTGLRRRFRSHEWGRDAIVWDIDQTNYIVRCKIQGSDEFIHCHYPRNWQTLPEFVRPGNAVRIAHKGGHKGFLEVIGHGRAIPTPVAGDSGQFPGWGTYVDEIISGGDSSPSDAQTGNDLIIEIDDMTYRIDGVLYGVVGEDVYMGGTVYMNDPPDAIMGTMGTGGITVALSAAPAKGYARYDLFVIGTDETVDYHKGTAAASDLVMPSVPADHIKVCHVLVLGGMTEVTSAHINALWENKVATALSISISGSYTGFTVGYFDEAEPVLLYSAFTSTPYCQISVDIKDQYGWNYDQTEGVDQTAVQFQLLGTGTLCKNPYGPFGTTQTYQTLGYSAYMYYKRDQNVTEVSPSIMISTSPNPVSGSLRIQLLDSGQALIT